MNITKFIDKLNKRVERHIEEETYPEIKDVNSMFGTHISILLGNVTILYNGSVVVVQVNDTNISLGEHEEEVKNITKVLLTRNDAMEQAKALYEADFG